MDITALMALLVSSLPFLLKMGEKAAEEAASKLGEDTWYRAKAVWAKLRPQIEANSDAKVAVEQVAAKPDSIARQSLLQEELEILLKENPDLTETLSRILQDETATSANNVKVQQTVNRNEGQVIGNMQESKAIGRIEGGVSGDVTQ